MNSYVKMLLFIIFTLCLFLIYLNLNVVENLTTINIEQGELCETYNDNVKKVGILTPVKFDQSYRNTLNSFNVKMAYNCCCVGKFEDDYVDLCALYNVLKLGVRCLDFEIRSFNDKPYVTCSTNLTNMFKDSKNQLDLEEVFQTINQYAFGQPIQNGKDPLFLHFRIRTNNIPTYDSMTKLIETYFSNKVLSIKYQNEYLANNIGLIKLFDLSERVIIMIDNSNTFYKNTKLFKYSNIGTNSAKCRLLTNSDIINSNKNELIEYNKRNLSMAIPDLTNDLTNLNSKELLDYGIQFIGMNYQNYDENLEYMMNFFEQNGHAFVLKENRLRDLSLKPSKGDEKKTNKREIDVLKNRIQNLENSIKILNNSDKLDSIEDNNELLKMQQTEINQALEQKRTIQENQANKLDEIANLTAEIQALEEENSSIKQTMDVEEELENLDPEEMLFSTDFDII